MSNQQWQQFLSGAGARFDGAGASFGDRLAAVRLALEGDVLVDLSHEGLIAVRGADAPGFLQNLLTTDIPRVSEHRSQLSAWCTPKGRVLALFRVIYRDDAFYLQLPGDLLERTLSRLRMYVLRAKVGLEDASDELVRIGLSGSTVAAGLRRALGACPERVDDVMQSGSLTLVRLPGPRPRLHALGPPEAVQPLWRALARDACPAGPEAWALLDILAGVPTVTHGTADAFLPQMLNLQALGGVSFTKGCYPGQEIVARTHHLGTLKRRLYLARAETDVAPEPGDPVYARGAEGTAGTVVNAQRHASGGVVLLVVVQISAAETEELRLADASGPLLRLQPLPYEV
ncbi:MAG: folate-binding protein YgfZ [Gammaproteobacteria bacterium]|nr:folate-binding protein YgfZ [Gammaproteobacteria bacterium]NIR85462.1 folate-binding protein YgfZ [Gammaproteobacteria bacterium]NIR89514.1 folate-binding protein YgfZ [Gammaproteobacteria bacterium]NIU06599.1 folate-binding protein YgfZ [Gammaproteobacteria bacterium]NIV53482.1 folate-binding protein [Gammaproteobacteria bacterium]